MSHDSGSPLTSYDKNEKIFEALCLKHKKADQAYSIVWENTWSLGTWLGSTIYQLQLKEIWVILSLSWPPILKVLFVQIRHCWDDLFLGCPSFLKQNWRKLHGLYHAIVHRTRSSAGARKFSLGPDCRMFETSSVTQRLGGKLLTFLNLIISIYKMSIFTPRVGFMGTQPVYLHRTLHLEGPHAWFNALLSPSWNSWRFLNKGLCMFILHCAPQIVQLVLFITVFTELSKRTARGKTCQVTPRPGAWKVLGEGSHDDYDFHTAVVTGMFSGPWMLHQVQAG